MTVHLESFFRQNSNNEKNLITQFYAIKTGLGVDKFLALYYHGIVANRALLKSAASLRVQNRCVTISDSVYDELQWSGGMATVSVIHDFQRKTRSSSAVQAAVTSHIMRNLRAYLNHAIAGMTDTHCVAVALASCNWMYDRSKALHLRVFSEDTARAYHFEAQMYKGSDKLPRYARMSCDNLHLLAGLCLLECAKAQKTDDNDFSSNAAGSVPRNFLGAVQHGNYLVNRLETAIFNKVSLPELKDWMCVNNIGAAFKASAPVAATPAPKEPKKRGKKAVAVQAAVATPLVTEVVAESEVPVVEPSVADKQELTAAEVATKVTASTEQSVRQETATLTCSLTLTVVEVNGMYSVDVNPGSVQAAVQPEKFSTPGVNIALSLEPLAARVTEYLSKRYLPDLAKSLTAEYNQTVSKELKAAKLRKAQEELQAEVAKLSPEAQELFNSMKKHYRG